MKSLPFLLISLILLGVSGCVGGHQSVTTDSLAQYRDTLIGNFSGEGLDTLIVEPVDTLSGYEWENDPFGGHHYKWRVFTKRGSVKPLEIDNTIGVHFVKEGDLDGDGKEEWGYVSEWPTSDWMKYYAFTNVNGEWRDFIDPTTIWLPHIDPQDSSWHTISKSEILRPSESKGFLKVKFSAIRDDGGNFAIIDTLIPINHQNVKE